MQNSSSVTLHTIFCCILSIFFSIHMHAMDTSEKRIEIAYIKQSGRSIMHICYQEPRIIWRQNGKRYTLTDIATYEQGQPSLPPHKHQAYFDDAKQQACRLLYHACTPLRASAIDHKMAIENWHRARHYDINIPALQCMLDADKTAYNQLPTLVTSCSEVNNLAHNMLSYLTDVGFTL